MKISNKGKTIKADNVEHIMIYICKKETPHISTQKPFQQEDNETMLRF